MRAQKTAPLPSLQLTRRRFLQSSAAAGVGLLVGFDLRVGQAAAQTSGVFAPNAFVRIAPDNTVTIIAKHIEFGQGTYTGLATILAEELDADWSQVRVESAPADAARYNNLLFGAVQGTGGSTAMANSWEQLRQAGAMTRAMLVAAARTSGASRLPRSRWSAACSPMRGRVAAPPSVIWPCGQPPCRRPRT
jgi:isoquinoline 1-oxidoreductase beta subunit